MAEKRKLLILTGATATGKSAFIYGKLTGLPLTIINADSRQVYHDLTISSASPRAADLEKFPHALYNFLPVSAAFSAGEFMRAAKNEIAKAISGASLPLLCGGTYFYLHALLYGLLPPVEIGEAVRSEVDALTSHEAYESLKNLDAKAAATNHPHNIQRVRRALMLCLETGGPISQIKKTGGIADEYDILLLIFDMDREVLRRRTAERVRTMLSSGLIAEAQGVLERFSESGSLPVWRENPALTGIGIREFFEVYEKTRSMPAELDAARLAEVEKKIAQNTIHLVKRQQTWFRNASPKPANTKTVDPSYENERIAALVKDYYLTAQ